VNLAKKSDIYTSLAFYHLSDNASTSVVCCTASGAGFETLVFGSYHRRTQIFLEGADPEDIYKLGSILKIML
jgi:hypothetical protein